MSEEAAAFLRARRRPLELVIFDCDGVLIDSEALCNRIVAEILTADGWAMTAEECEHRFIGMSFYAMQPEIEARLGRSLGDDWVDRVVDEVTEAMAHEVEPVPGARDALEATSALGLQLAHRIQFIARRNGQRSLAAPVGWTSSAAGCTARSM